MITDVPGVLPLTVPVEDPIVATPVEPDVQVPPLVPSVSVVEALGHRDSVPPIAAGRGLTVIGAVM